jgi:hypothetical protein
MKRTQLIILGIIFGAGLASVQAQLINVQFADNATGNAYGGGGPAVEPTQSGAAVLGSAGDTWNARSGFTYSSYPTGGSGGPYPLVKGNGTPSGVTVSSLIFNGSFVSIEPNFPSYSAFTGTPWANLMGAYISVPSSTAPGYVLLAGLAPSATWDLVLYNAANANSGNFSAVRTTSFTVDGNTLSSTWDGVTSKLVQGVDYVEFTGVKSDAMGNLVIIFSGSAGSGLSAEGDFNGFQLEQVPPQLTIIRSGTNVTLTWPTNATGFTLEFATNLVSPIFWNTNSAAPVVINGQNTVTNPISGTRMFFRLSQ